MADNHSTPSTADDAGHEEKFEDASDTTPQPIAHDLLSSEHDKPVDVNAPENENVTDKEHTALSQSHKQESTGVQSNRNSKSSDGGSTKSKSGDEPRSPGRVSRSNSTETNDTTPKAAPAKQSRFGAFSASLPSVPWGSAAAARRPSSNNRDPSPQPPSQPAAPGRKTPFGWLSRATSTSTVKSPPLPPRPHPESRRTRGTSISTLGSNSELMLKALEDSSDSRNGDRGSARQSLKEKFKLLRQRDEGIESTEHGEKAENSTSGGEQVSVTADDDKKDAPLPSPGPLSPTLNPDLPPGTVSGFLSAASDAATPIDWDFWQTVVNEGPQAVARTSPEELTSAIAGGIPQTIRGVIWQVLASSKNEDLETLYHELCVRGTKDEVKDDTATNRSSATVNGSVKEKSLTSSKSSVHSDNSTPGTSTNLGLASPTPSSETVDSVNGSKLPAQLGDHIQRSKSDAAAIAKLEKMIKRDMGSRTSYSKYAAAAGFQDGLFNVCKAYALFDDAVGYPQGMNFVIMPMLFNMSEEEAFCLLVRIMHKYQLREMFVHDMPGLHLHLYQFERLLEDLEPALYCHLNRRSVTPKLYATQWFLTLFAYRLPLQLVMRVFDLVLCEGLEGAILKFGMALIQRNVQTLLAMEDMQALTTFLKEKLFDVYIDQAPTSKSIMESGFFGNSGGSEHDIYRADILVQDACSVKLTPDMLTRYTAEYEDKTKAEKSRETELENLRTDTVTKAAQIRSLEQRAEKSDAEHIGLANELVKLKVENQDLIDRNESLTGQVKELKKVAQSEAANTEERLRASTEKVMQKNIEVQNENRHMEEQMSEMERELVEMKMKYAELSGEHEGLKQKWSDLKKALE